MNIDTIRGDTLNIQLEFESDTVLDLTSEDFDITFSLKQFATAIEYVFQKDKTAVTEIGDNIFMLRIAPEDTVDLVPGFYYYDIEVKLGDDIYTVAIGRMHIEVDITRPPVVLPEFPFPDVNGDGIVDANDASAVQTAWVKISTGQPSGLTPEQEDLADANRDGIIDGRDASLVFSFYAKCSVGLYTDDQAGWTQFMSEQYVPPQE
jgi:hypothetical protein